MVTCQRVIVLIVLVMYAGGAPWRGVDTPSPIKSSTTECKHRESCAFFADVLLVVKLNPVRVPWVDLLLNYYSTGFPNIVFFSALRRSDATVYRPLTTGCRNTTIHMVEDNYGFCDHEVVAAASAWYPNYKGYLFLSDDVLLSFWKLTKLSKDAVWRQPSKQRGVEEMTESERRAMLHVAIELPRVRRVFPSGTTRFPFAATSGVYYVPSVVMPDFRAVSAILYKHRTYNEWGTPIVLTASSEANGVATVNIAGKLQWGRKRFFAVKTLLRDRVWYHPVRASSESFMRMTLWAHSIPLLTASTKVSVRDLFSAHCLECSTHPHDLVIKKGLYHSCREAPVQLRAQCPRVATDEGEFSTYTAAVAERSRIDGVPATTLVGGRVVVPPDRRGASNPFELSHEGFWGGDVTQDVYTRWLPSLNWSSCIAPYSMPFPQCCGR
jgi:hypothetical protein